MRRGTRVRVQQRGLKQGQTRPENGTGERERLGHEGIGEVLKHFDGMLLVKMIDTGREVHVGRDEWSLENADMTTEKTGVHVHVAMCEVKKKLAVGGGITKDRSASMGGAGNYNFRGIDDVYNVLCGMTADVGLAMYPRIVERQVDYQTNDRGKVQTHYHVTLELDMVSAIDGSTHMVRSVGESIDTGDKASGKAQSYAFKMATLMAFMIPTHGELDNEAFAQEVGPAFIPVPPKQVQPKAEEPPPPAAAEPAKRTRGPNKPKDAPKNMGETLDAAGFPLPDPAAPPPEPSQPSTTTNDVDAMVERIGTINTFPLLFAIAQDAEATIAEGSPDKVGVFEVIKTRAIHLFGEAKSMVDVKAGFEIVKAMGQPAELKGAANAAYARFNR